MYKCSQELNKVFSELYSYWWSLVITGHHWSSLVITGNNYNNLHQGSAFKMFIILAFGVFHYRER